MGLRDEKQEKNVEGLICKSKGFHPSNLSNPKGESFDTKRINYGGEGRSTTAGLKEKLAEGFSRGITLGFFNSSNQAWVLARSFS